jgi:small-conductance mechanosensitive channel
MFASPLAVAVKAPTVAQPTLADQLTAFGRATADNLLRLDARQVAFNLLASAVVLIAAAGLMWTLKRVFDHWVNRFTASQGGAVADKGRRRPTVAGATWVLLRLLVFAGVALVILGIWGVNPRAWLTDGVGARLLHLALIAVGTTALVEGAGFVIRRFVEGIAGRSANRHRAAQLRTLGPLLIGSVQSVLLLLGLLTFLSELGVKVGPLLASAGVVGIAVGFGAQTLVKDFFTGLFLIAEDVVSLGDNISIKDASGTVEAMTIRTIRLRGANGTLHIFPYSEAQVVHNHTKLFSSYLFEIVVNYECDLDRALAIMGEVGEGLRADPQFARLITRPFEVLGVDKLTPAGATLKARVVTEPQAQWQVGREYNRRLKEALDKAGIGVALQTLAPRPPADNPPAPPRELRAIASEQRPRS